MISLFKVFTSLCDWFKNLLVTNSINPSDQIQNQQEAISQIEIVFRFRKDIQSEKGWRFYIMCMRSPGVKGICADALLCDSLSCQSLTFVVEARYSTEPIQ